MLVSWQYGRSGAGIMEADDRQVTTVFTVQPSFHHRHSTNRVSWSVTIVIVGERFADEVRCDCTFSDDGIMEVDDRQVTTVFTVQPSFHRRHSTNRVSWSVTVWQLYCNSCSTVPLPEVGVWQFYYNFITLWLVCVVEIIYVYVDTVFGF